MPLFRDGECDPLRRWPEAGQIGGFIACTLLVHLIFILLFSPFGWMRSLQSVEQSIQVQGHVFSFFMMVIADPITRTIYAIWLPYFAARMAKRKPFMQIIWVSVWFALLYLPNGILYAVESVGVGWVLAGCFLFCRKESWLKAYRVTAVTYAGHNLAVYLYCWL